jgi:hypothetical protein
MQKHKLRKIAGIIQKHLPLIEAMENPETSAQFTPVFYESGLNLLLKNNSFDSMVSKRKKFLNAKMVKAAKNLSIQFEDFGMNAYVNSFSSTLESVATLNGPMQLLPIEDNVKELVFSSLRELEDEAANFYHALLLDIFSTGRMHQEIVGGRNNGVTGLRKYSSFNLNDASKFERLNSYLTDDFAVVIGALKSSLKNCIAQSYKEEFSKEEMVNKLQKVYSKFSFDIESALRLHAWRTYSAGNLYQLDRDSTKMVAWKTSHQVDDCIHCRAIETGELILKDKNNAELRHKRNIDQVSYYLEDIIKLSEFSGLSTFAHEDCRCFWVSSDK